MAEDEKDRRLDAVLDSLLSAYAAAEPRPGLDLRIRARLKARAAQQQRQWMLLFAASAAVLVLVVALATPHTSKQRVPENIVKRGTPSGLSSQAIPPPPASKATAQFASHRQASVRETAKSRAMLEVANAMEAADNPVFEREKLYLIPEPQPEPGPAVKPQTSAPNITIQDLGVQSIEIKELPSAKGADSKGSL